MYSIKLYAEKLMNCLKFYVRQKQIDEKYFNFYVCAVSIDKEIMMNS